MVISKSRLKMNTFLKLIVFSVFFNFNICFRNLTQSPLNFFHLSDELENVFFTNEIMFLRTK